MTGRLREDYPVRIAGIDAEEKKERSAEGRTVDCVSPVNDTTYAVRVRERRSLSRDSVA
jgi:hypothetical protein